METFSVFCVSFNKRRGIIKKPITSSSFRYDRFPGFGYIRIACHCFWTEIKINVKTLIVIFQGFYFHEHYINSHFVYMRPINVNPALSVALITAAYTLIATRRHIWLRLGVTTLWRVLVSLSLIWFVLLGKKNVFVFNVFITKFTYSKSNFSHARFELTGIKDFWKCP